MPETVQILKESKARFEGVIFKQEADLGTEKSTSCKVIDEATGEVIAQSGGGEGGDSDFTTANVTIKYDNEPASDAMIIAPVYYDTEGYVFAMGDIEISSSSDTSAKIILYKGKAIIHTSDNTYAFDPVRTSGDIEIDESEPTTAVVTGDGVITVYVQEIH